MNALILMAALSMGAADQPQPEAPPQKVEDLNKLTAIRKVVGHKKIHDMTPDHWKESIAHAYVMFEEAGVETVLVPGDLNGPEPRFNGELWRP